MKTSSSKQACNLAIALTRRLNKPRLCLSYFDQLNKMLQYKASTSMWKKKVALPSLQAFAPLSPDDVETRRRELLEGPVGSSNVPSMPTEAAAAGPGPSARTAPPCRAGSPRPAGP